MKVCRSISFLILLLASSLLARTGFSQMFKPQIDVSLGGGMNLSFFDVGGGSPGLILTSSTMYHWTEHWKAGMVFGVHNARGTDEGTRYLGRGLAFNSHLYEFSLNVEYLFYYSSSWTSKWKQKINPMLPYGGTWKRKIKPFLTAGAGIVQYKPYVYYYVTDGGLDENPAYAKVAPVFNGGAGLYYFANRYLSIALDAKVYLPLFNYFEGYVPEEIEDKLDVFAVFGIRIIWSLSAS
jgi:hypothetical protein